MPKRSVTVLVCTVLLAGCQTDPGSTTANQPDGSTIVLREMAYVPNTISVTASTPQTVTLTNDGGIVHDLAFANGWTSGTVQPGRSLDVQLPAFTQTTVGWCTVPGHRDAGMELTVTVAQ